MYFKYTLILLLSTSGLCFAAAAVWNSSNTAKHDFFAGFARPLTDKLLTRAIVSKPAATRFFVPIKTVDEYTYPPEGTRSTANITAVYVYDLITNGTGGYVDSMRNGPGFRNVTLKFKSKRGYGYLFQVDIFGV